MKMQQGSQSSPILPLMAEIYSEIRNVYSQNKSVASARSCSGRTLRLGGRTSPYSCASSPCSLAPSCLVLSFVFTCNVARHGRSSQSEPAVRLAGRASPPLFSSLLTETRPSSARFRLGLGLSGARATQAG